MAVLTVAKRRALVIASLLLSVVAYLYLSSPDGIAVSEDGTVRNTTDEIRAKLQGKGFWQEQLRRTNRELEWLISEPERRQIREERHNEFLERSAERREERYRRYPSRRPSPSEEKVEALREEADAIEAEEAQERRDVRREKRIVQLEQILKTVAQKVAQP